MICINSAGHRNQVFLAWVACVILAKNNNNKTTTPTPMCISVFWNTALIEREAEIPEWCPSRLLCPSEWISAKTEKREGWIIFLHACMIFLCLMSEQRKCFLLFGAPQMDQGILGLVIPRHLEQSWFGENMGHKSKWIFMMTIWSATIFDLVWFPEISLNM